MSAVFLFILKSIFVSGILTGYYWIALRNKQFHRYNRFYLLFTLYASIQLPLLQVKWFTIYQYKQVIRDPGAEIIERAAIPGSQTDWRTILLVACGTVSLVLLSILVIRVINILYLKRQYGSKKMNGFDFVYTDLPRAPFSFLNNLFWRNDISLASGSGAQIFQHELAHIQQRHTYDKLISQVMVCIGWFNPFYWILQREINMIHEFLADRKAIQDGDTESFARMLLEVHNSGYYLNPSHQFSYSPISRRLSMIIRSKTSFPYLRKLVLFPLLFLTVIPFSFTVMTITKEVYATPPLMYNETSVSDTVPAKITKVVTVPSKKPVSPDPGIDKQGIVKLPKMPKAPAISKLPAKEAKPAQPGVKPLQGVPVPDIKLKPGSDPKRVSAPGAIPVPAVKANDNEGIKPPSFAYAEERKGIARPDIEWESNSESSSNNSRQSSSDKNFHPGKYRDEISAIRQEIERDRKIDPDLRKRKERKDRFEEERNNKAENFHKQKENRLKIQEDFFKKSNELFPSGEDLLKPELWKKRPEPMKLIGDPWKHDPRKKNNEDKKGNTKIKRPAA